MREAHNHVVFLKIYGCCPVAEDSWMDFRSIFIKSGQILHPCPLVRLWSLPVLRPQRDYQAVNMSSQCLS